jgi:N-acetylglucosamine-6-phosphate deacetylase
MKFHRIFYLVITGILILKVLIPTMAQSQEYSGWSTDGRRYIKVTVGDGSIHQVTIAEDPPSGDRTYITSGLIDTQVNGYHSISFSDDGLTAEKIRTVTEAMWKEGVTTYFPTLVTSDPELVRRNLRILATSLSDPELAHSIPGIFLEGPYISPIDGFRGAHDANWVKKPDWNEFKGFIEASGNRIIQVGLAPEIEGAMEFIRECSLHGINVALAHHNGTAEQIRDAVNNGARVSTHLGNGVANMIHRHNNPIWPQLANEGLYPSIIADGHHLNAEELKVFYSVKGPDGLFLVSDATKLAGMPAGTYEWNGRTVVMTEDGMLQLPEQQVLAGASFPVRTGIMNMVKLAGISLADACNMASGVPARVYNLSDRGEIRTGKSADLILFRIENGEMKILKTIVQGKEVSGQ